VDIAIIGLPQCGKTTLFNALTRGKADTAGGGGGASQMHMGVVKVPDPRLDVLREMYRRPKAVQVEIKYWDLPGPESLARSQGIGGKYRNILQGADAFLLVVRACANPGVPHPLGSGGDPGRDLEAMLSELALADLEVLERAGERLEGDIKKSRTAERPTLARHREPIQKVTQGIESGIPLRRQHLTESEASFLTGYQLLTGKPVVVAFNTDEAGPELSLSQLDLNPDAIAGLGEVSLCGKLEAELALMSEAEEAEFREALGLGEQARSRVIDVSYRTLGLISFLTIADDLVQAWSVPAGLSAQEAAGAIHSDFHRGFIRAEVIPFADLARCGGIAQGRKEGVLRSEGKTYQVKDGDVINFLVNV
jgi:GTP-binding protein YchF